MGNYINGHLLTARVAQCGNSSMYFPVALGVGVGSIPAAGFFVLKKVNAVRIEPTT